MSNCRAGSFLLALVKAVLLILCCFVTVFSIFSFVIREVVLHEKNYTTVVQTSEFSQQIKGYVREELEAECLFYDLPFSVIDDALANDQIDSFFYEYTCNIYGSLTKGEPLQMPPWDSRPFVDAVQSFFNSLPEEERPMDRTAADTVGGELSEIALSVLRAGIDETVLDTGHTLYSHPLIQRMKDGFFILLSVVCLIVIVGLILERKRWIYQLYKTLFSMGAGCAVVFVPFWLMQRYDPASRLALMDSPLKLYADTVLNAILDQAVSITGWVFAAASIALVLLIVLQLLPKRAK